MFALKPRLEIAFRVLLIAVILFSAPLNSFSAQAAEITVTPTETVTETPTAEPTFTPTEFVTETPTAEPTITPAETVIPNTETPVPVTETPSPVASSVPTETAASVTATAPATGSDTPLLTLSANPSFIPPAGVLMLNWAVEGISFEGLTLQILLPEGFSPQGNYEGTYDEVNRTLSLTLTSLNGQVQLKTSIAGVDVLIEATLLKDSEILTSINLFLPAHEQFVLDQQGGEITAMNGKLKIQFPKDALSEEAVIEIGAPSGDAIPAYSLLGMPFEIKAQSKESGQELKHFSKELSIFVSYADLGIPQTLENSLYLYWYNSQTEEWAALPTIIDTESKTLQAFTDHFTVFDMDVNNWQATHLPTLDSFQVSNFTGAATYSIPIELPAGPGGFQPNLALSYNSQVVDQSTVGTQASWVGMGWDLSSGSIELDTHGTPNGGVDDTHLLNVGGVSTRIVRDSNGAYHMADENFWKIQYNSSVDTWQVWDKQGNQYFFEQRSSFPYQEGGCGTFKKTYLWSLTKQRNIFGQEFLYTYATETKTLKHWWYYTSGGTCEYSMVADETAIYPSTITYANGKYRIRFDKGSAPNRKDYTLVWDTDTSFHNYQKYRLQNIYVEQDSNGDGSFETIIRRYQFTYAADTDSDIIFPGHTWTATGKTTTLRSVRQYGVGGTTALPAVTFTYGDNMHLTLAENGYGGKVQFDYNLYYYSADARYSYTRFDRVGLPATTEQPLWPVGSCRYMSNSRWTARTTSDRAFCIDNGSEKHPNPNDGLGIRGTAIGGFGKDLLRPGGAYKVTASIGNSNGPTMTFNTGVFDGTTDLMAQGGIVVLPKTASKLDILLKTTGGGNNQWIDIYNVKLQLLPAVYRVQTKHLFDGKGNEYQYTYTYTSPAVNDNAHSTNVCPQSPFDPNCYEYIEKFSEFRGHSQVTETGPDGLQTITTYYQDDILKGRPINAIIKDNANKALTSQHYSYDSTALSIQAPGHNECSICPPPYIGLTRTWVRTASQESHIYLNDGINYHSTRVVYTYESTYGNLTDQAEYEGSSTTHYRKTHFDYFPNATAYLVGLPARQQVKNSAGAVIAETLNLYDGANTYNTAPTLGKLTAMRTWISGTNYSQATFGYDSWGNRTTVTMYSGYGTASSPPTTGAATTTTAYDSTYHVYPISQTTPPTTNNNQLDI